MPPRRRQQPEEIDWGDLQDIVKLETRSRVCLDHLKDSYFEMAKELGKTFECPTCLEVIDCKRCMTLLVCGHWYHLSCYMRQNKYECAVCRN